MTTMTLTEVLSRIKTIGKQIDGLTNANALVAVETNGRIAGVDAEQALRTYAANAQSLTALSLNREKLIAALLVANAATYVTINGQRMLIAAAISRKNTATERLPVLQTLYAQIRTLAERAAQNNDRLRESAISEVTKMSPEQRGPSIDTAIEALVARRTQHFRDPANLMTTLPTMIRDLEEFLVVVDSALAVVNATTTIEIAL